MVTRRGSGKVPEEVVEVSGEEREESRDVERVRGVADGDWEAEGWPRGLVAVLVALGREAGSPWAGGPDGEVGIGLEYVGAGFRVD